MKIDICQLGTFVTFSLLRCGMLTAMCHVTVSTVVGVFSLGCCECAQYCRIKATLYYVFSCNLACSCVYPPMQESLAFMFEMANLREDALREYDELEQIYSETGKYRIMSKYLASSIFSW